MQVQRMQNDVDYTTFTYFDDKYHDWDWCKTAARVILERLDSATILVADIFGAPFYNTGVRKPEDLEKLKSGAILRVLGKNEDYNGVFFDFFFNTQNRAITMSVPTEFLNNLSDGNPLNAFDDYIESIAAAIEAANNK